MLVAVVGPSGAGKDTLLAGARAAPGRRCALPLRPPRHHPPRGCRRRGSRRPLTRAAFAALRDAGGFALWWEAHGLLYGIPRDIEADLAAGRVVVANLSRAALAEAAARYPAARAGDHRAGAAAAARLAARGARTWPTSPRGWRGRRRCRRGSTSRR